VDDALSPGDDTQELRAYADLGLHITKQDMRRLLPVPSDCDYYDLSPEERKKFFLNCNVRCGH
jgi:hypothetical protein